MNLKTDSTAAMRSFAISRRLGLLATVLLCLVPYAPGAPGSPARAAEVVEVPGTTAEPAVLGGAVGAVVVLAETADAPGTSPLAHFRALAEASNRYYALNAYGSLQFSFTFLDADGPAGAHDWYDVGPSLAAYADHEEAFAVAALQRAFAGANLPEVVHLGRAIVIYPTRSTAGVPRALFTSTILRSSEDYIEVSGADRVTRLYIPNLVLVSEEDDLYRWAHELGHTLYAKDALQGWHDRLSDRYEYPQPERRFGHVGPWDLMGAGSRMWIPESPSARHMSSYTKEAAGWLRYTQAEWDHEYLLTALEHQRLGDAVLALDDPLSDDPACYYILEARDSQAEFGAPESGVMIYSVTYDDAAGHAVVNAVGPQQRGQAGTRSLTPGDRPTLRGIAQADGTTEYVAEGIRITLLAESFSPYRATVRIERS